MNHNIAPELYPETPHRFREITPPSSLRSDEHALTFIEETPDGESLGYIYSLPLFPHDYDMTQGLIDNGLSVGEISRVKDFTRDTIKYAIDTDFILLTSLLNSSAPIEEGQQDIVTSLQLISDFLIQMQEKCGFNPAEPKVEMFAINRQDGRVELLAPYTRDTSGIDPKTNFEKLKKDILSKSSSQEERNALVSSFSIKAT